MGTMTNIDATFKIQELQARLKETQQFIFDQDKTPADLQAIVEAHQTAIRNLTPAARLFGNLALGSFATMVISLIGATYGKNENKDLYLKIAMISGLVFLFSIAIYSDLSKNIQNHQNWVEKYTQRIQIKTAGKRFPA